MRSLSSVPSDDSSSEGTGSPGLAGLLRRIGRGDEAAFAALYDATSARVHGLVLRVVRDPAQAEEVTQETFLQVWRYASRYDESLGSAQSWLLTLAHRRAVDRVRSAESAGRNDTAYHGTTQTTPHDTTAEAAETSLEAHRVRAALETLTAPQREALQLAYFGGYTHTEVAAMLELPIGTAKTRIRDGLIRLRDAMGVSR
ncbi:ECF RNA polymerase sigma factor SigK [Nocardioides sp. NPDC057772]|uniref:ECF RNA polymerase sigma factor SigK n=1 Tax=Nocardioides sp. NPDC057772 TaxID=3346245 RepID=UPI003671AFA9